jgi:DUF1680 family protein
MEGLDQTQQDAKTFSLYVAKRDGATHEEYKADVLDGVMVLSHAGGRRTESGDALYAAAGAGTGKAEAAELKLVPYYAWDNREESSMQVWVPVEG